MKTHYIAILLAIFSLNLNSQITLTSSTHTPQIGDSFEYISMQNPNVSLQAMGENQIWDLSSVSGDIVEYNYIDPSLGTEPMNFPNSDIVESAGGAENYYISSESDYSVEGTLFPDFFRVTYTDKREFLKFPMSYGNSFDETFGGTAFVISSNQSFERSGDINISAIGFGQLILPYGTFDNVLQVRSVLNYSDLFGGVLIGTYQDTIITLYNASNRTQLASYSVNYSNGELGVEQIAYLSESSLTPVSINEYSSEPSNSLFPNPATTSFSISNSNVSSSVNLEIYDTRGQLIVSHLKINKAEKVDVSQLDSGIYIVKYFVDNKHYTNRLIVE